MPTATAEHHRTTLASWLNDRARYLRYSRGHAVVHVVDDTTDPTPPAPAWYDPKTGEAYVHVDRAGIDMKALRASSNNQDRDKAWGLMAHEVAHSTWSEWLLKAETRKAMTKAQHAVATLFEEMRIESRAVNTDTDLRQKLRASLGIIVKNMTADKLPTTRYEIANAWALVFGRSITTVATDDEVRWVDDAARTVLGDDDVEYLTDLLQEALELKSDGSQLKSMIRITQEWLDVVGEPEHPEEGCGCSGGEEPGEAGEGEGAGEGESGKGEPDEDGTAPKDSSAGVANSVSDDTEVEDKAYSESVTDDEAELVKDMMERALDEVTTNWNDAPVDMANPEEMARKVFGGKRSKSLAESTPTARHQRHAAETAKVLESLVIPAINKVSVNSAVPPGRLRTREALRGAAERAQGRMVTARPWEAMKRRHTSARPIVVGIATDTSGSMRWAEQAVADFAYTWANGGHRVGARTAAVTFGDNALSTSAPGEVMSMVRRKDANGGTEKADWALAALDGALKLSHPNGCAKLLVVVSDGHLVITGENLRVLKRLKDFKAGGTKVLWVTPSSNSFIREMSKQNLAEVVTVKMSYTSMYSAEAEEEHTVFNTIQAAVLQKLRTLTN